MLSSLQLAFPIEVAFLLTTLASAKGGFPSPHSFRSDLPYRLPESLALRLLLFFLRRMQSRPMQQSVVCPLAPPSRPVSFAVDSLSKPATLRLPFWLPRYYRCE